VSIGRYPRQRKWRARASLLARGASRRRRARVAPASRPRRVQLAAGEGPSGVSELRPPSRESPSRVAPMGRVVTKVGASRHQKWRDSSPKWRDSAPKLQTSSQTRPNKRGAIGSRPAPGTPSGKRSARTHRTVSVGCMPDEGTVPSSLRLVRFSKTANTKTYKNALEQTRRV
jgi:hypothetical protein